MPSTVIDLAIEKGLHAIAITDHFDPMDSGLSNRGATVQDLKKHFASIRAYAQGKPIRVLCGIETCTGFDGRLTLPQEVRQLCDLIITSPHYIEFDGPIKPGDYYNADYWQAYKKKLLNMALGEGDVLGHPEGYLPIKPMGTAGTTYQSRQLLCREICDRFFDEAFVEELGDRLLTSGKAYELHGATNTPREWVVRRLAQKGVTFSIGSDAHAMDILGKCKTAWEWKNRYGFKLWAPSVRGTNPVNK